MSGIVQFRFELGSGEGVVRVTSVAVNDGHWHEIRLERMGNRAQLTVDGTHVAQGVSPGTSDILNSQHHLLYFGSEVWLLKIYDCCSSSNSKSINFLRFK